MASQAMVSRVVMVYTLLISEAIQDRVPEMKDPQPEPPIYIIYFRRNPWCPAGRGATTLNYTRAVVTRQR